MNSVVFLEWFENQLMAACIHHLTLIIILEDGQCSAFSLDLQT
jgi:transcriptional antiterminator Rof (Rho-off)